MKKANKIITILIALILFFSILMEDETIDDNITEGNLEVHFIDVGQGDSTLIINGEESMLIDGGKNQDAESLVNYIRNQNITKLKYVIGTHPHEDHIGGLDKVIDNFDVEKVIMPNVTATTKTFEDVLDSIMNKGLTITKAKSGDKYDLNGAEIDILGPNSEKYSNLNNYSVVVKLTFGNNSFMFTGDAEELAEKEILEKYAYKLKSDVLKLGHHGSSTSNSEEFLSLVNPEFAVISLGKDNTYGHPHKEVLERVMAKDIHIYRTDEEGTIIVISDGNIITFNNGVK